jgi:hypothetical protein
MTKDFYSSPTYRAKQSEKTRLNWLSGKMDFLRKTKPRHCERYECKNIFNAAPSDPKIYCSQRCAAIENNTGRVQSSDAKTKISRALAGRKYPNRPKAPPKLGTCANPNCGKEFLFKDWRPMNRPFKYCSALCAIKDVGSKPTSPRAARAKAGIRSDVSPTIYFFSRWEANFARLMNYLNIQWIHQPKTFQLKSQKYTPDFYLPDFDIYIEVKNYLSDYSRNRDMQFRKAYPELKLILLLKEEYLALQNEYASKIKEWEYKNSPIAS